MKHDALPNMDLEKTILGSTPTRLDVDFASPSSTIRVSSLILDGTIASNLQKICDQEEMTMFVLALGIFYCSMCDYCHEPCAIGSTHGMNKVLVPFLGGR